MSWLNSGPPVEEEPADADDDVVTPSDDDATDVEPGLDEPAIWEDAVEAATVELLVPVAEDPAKDVLDPPADEALAPEELTGPDADDALLTADDARLEDAPVPELPTFWEELDPPVMEAPRHTPSSQAVWGPQSALTLQRSRHSPSWGTVLEGQRVAHPRFNVCSTPSSNTHQGANGCCCPGGRIPSSYNAHTNGPNPPSPPGGEQVWLRRPPRMTAELLQATHVTPRDG